MKKKEDIYVVVDTPKKAKKLQKVLDMFGIKFHKDQFNRDQFNYIIFYFDDDSRLYSTESNWLVENKQKVSIKELRNILAVEHLKEGDVVVVKNNSGKWIVKLTGKDNERFEHSASYNLDLGRRNDEKFTERHNKIYGASFIRYDTEEEKSLLEGKPKELTKEEVEKKVVEYAVSVDWDYDVIQKYINGGVKFKEYAKLDGAYSDDKAKIIIEKFKPKSIEVGKWYKGNGDKLIFTTSSKQNGHVKAYGFGANGGWFEDDNTFSWLTDDLKEATKEEVKQALVKEAEKRYGEDWKSVKIKQHADGEDWQEFGLNLNRFSPNFYPFATGKGYNRNGVIYYKGKWAEVLPQSDTRTEITDQDISTLERLHDTLADVHGYSLEFEIMKSARVLAEKLRELNTKTK